MKYFILVTCLAITINAFGQEIFHLEKIDKEGVILDKAWKFHAGDDPEWSKPGFDDSGWGYTDPTEELHHLPHVREAEIGWYR
jgi:hypothetical protein